MILGIVGNEAAKFTRAGEVNCRLQIRSLIFEYHPRLIVSGGCHLGGVDIWAVEEANKYGIATLEFLPQQLKWYYYKKRNIQIAEKADVTVCLAVQRLPKLFTGMRWPTCYHCGTETHIKSGGCWTTKYANAHGKKGYTIEIYQGTAR